ncbi:MAG: uncharacterized protein QOI38_1806 [Sphingomonadales bacterium]|jgi:uncharacterized protein|nr:uncharacterized protein [Sphingomonadales bacterium]
MTAATEPPPRILTLDIVRGIAVMGILAMNIVAFAMPDAAYMNPAAYGSHSDVDYVSWAMNFVLIDGKMRGLFSFMFGASMLLVIEKAAAKGESPAAIHFRRMLWLLLFGYLHYYFIWHGDILTGYATIGLLAWFFRNKEPRKLIFWGLFFVAIQFLLFAAMAVGFNFVSAAASAPNPDPAMVRQWADMQQGIAAPSAAQLGEEIARYRGPWLGVAHHQLFDRTFQPLVMLVIFGWETLGYMLLGMAALKNGFFTGSWDDARYRRIAAIGFAVAIPVYALLAFLIWRSGFSALGIVTWAMPVPVLVRPVMVVAIAALVILLTRGGGALTARIAAAGRAAFTNYLGSSILMTGLFYGWGLGRFGTIDRAQLWLVVIAMWAIMLIWSKPWLDRFQYGPFEWLWRSLARWKLQPMRRQPQRDAAAAAA